MGTAELITALNHPSRRRILLALEEQEFASPIELSKSLEEPISSVSYHVAVLAKCGAIELTRTQQVRGALEHFYSRVPLDGDAKWFQAALKASGG
jgi:DNA-binding transcriptional ArsR family regulator